MMLIYDLTYEQLVDFLLENNHKKFRAEQIWTWLYKQKVETFSEMANLPLDLINLLEKHFVLKALELVLKHQSADGTLKCL